MRASYEAFKKKRVNEREIINYIESLIYSTSTLAKSNHNGEKNFAVTVRVARVEYASVKA